MNSESEPEPQQVAEEVRRLVVSAGDKGISGSQVGLLLRAKWPSFSPAKLGVATLREFIRNQMSEVKELRRAGGDVIYGLPDVTAKGDREDLDTDLDLWRVWISPLSPFGIAVDPSTGEVRRIFIGDLPEGNVQIKPAPAEAHRSIAKHFLDTRSETFDQHSRASLNEILDNSDARWWKRWNDILKSVSPQITRNWFMFRERALVDALREALKTSGLTEDIQVKAFENILKTRQRVPLKAKPSATPAAAELETRTSPRHEELVVLVQKVVSRLTEDELRAMSLPLGLVLDSLLEKPKRR